MASRAQIKGITGLSKLRRTLRRMPELTNELIRPEIEKAAQNIHEDMVALTPARTGLAIAKQDYKISPDGLTAKIGVRTKVRATKAFYLAFLDSGTKGGNGVPAMPALHIRERAFDANKDDCLRDIKKAVAKALEKASRE